MRSDEKIISIPYEGYKDENKNYCSNFSVTYYTTGKFLIVFIRLILGKVGVDGFLAPRRESDIRYKIDLKIMFKDLGWKQRFLRPFLTEFPCMN